MALAYFITFTTYGTWLPGMAKGSVDQNHNVYGTPLLAADPQREREARLAMAQRPYVMGAEEREIACGAMVGLAEDRGWDLLAVHVRSNHVHVVLTADGTPERIMSALKARISRDLTSAGFGNADRRRWTRHGSTKHLFTREAVESAVRYVLDEQGQRMAYFAKEPRTE